MSVRIIKDTDRIDALFASIKETETRSLYVGVASSEPRKREPAPKKKTTAKAEQAAPTKAPQPTQITNAVIAYMNEYGTATIPARPFLIPSITQSYDKIKKLLEPSFNPKTGALEISQAKMNVAGLYAQNQVRAFVRRQEGFKPLSPKTIEARKRKRKNRKAGEKALIDTGNLLKSITYVVDVKGG